MTEHQGLAFVPALPTAWRGWRVLAAGILLVAAGLKAHQLVTSPAAATHGLGADVFAGVPFLTGVVVAEILLAGWMLAMVYPAITRWLGAGVFTAFAGVALTQALGGAASCGCFGEFSVNPWIVMGVDLVLAAGFVWFRPGDRATGAAIAGRGRVLACAVTSVGVAAGVGVWIASAEEPVTLADGGDLLGEGAFVMLEPASWIGQPCPLLTHIQTPVDLTAGDQTLVLYRYNCPPCIATFPAYESRARAGESVVLISMPPHAGPGLSPVPADSACTTGRLSDIRKWFVETPVEVRLHRGRVVFAEAGGFETY